MTFGFGAAATLISAVLYATAFPPLDVPGAAAIALAPFFAALRGRSPSEAAALGALWGVAAAYGLGIWFPGSIAAYFHQPLAVGALFFGGVALAMVAPYTALFAVAAQRILRSPPVASTFGVAAAWSGAELLRARLVGWVLDGTSNPWGLSGYAVADFAPLAQLASLAGVSGLSFCVALLNAAVVELVLGWRSVPSRVAAAAAVAVPLVASLGGYAALLAAEPPLGGAAREVAVAQANAAVGSQWRSDAYGENLERYAQLSLAALAAGPVDTLVWPESALTFFVEDDASYRAALAGLTRTLGAELLAGGPRRESREGGERYFNALFQLSGGSLVAHYDKQKLLPFAETNPLATVDPMERSFGGVRSFTPGAETALLETRLGRAGVLICNEAMLPELAARRVRDGAEILINPSNDTWISHPQYVQQQLRISALRAVEQRRYLVRASTSGPSVIVDPWGRTQARTPALEAAWLRGAVEPRRDRTLYSALGDTFGGACCAAAAALVWRGRRA